MALIMIPAHLAVPTLTIHIDRRYCPGSCEYSAILDHEQEHVRITQQTLKRWKDGMHLQLESAVQSWRDRWLPSTSQQEIKAAIDHTSHRPGPTDPRRRRRAACRDRHAGGL
jgi:hypothetical protein